MKSDRLNLRLWKDRQEETLGRSPGFSNVREAIKQLLITLITYMYKYLYLIHPHQEIMSSFMYNVALTHILIYLIFPPNSNDVESLLASPLLMAK